MARKRRPATPAGTRPAEVAGLRGLWPVWCALAICVWVAFSPVLDNGFVDWDDQQWILENHSFRGLGWDQIRYAFTTNVGGVYQPLGWLLQSLTYAAYGLEPRGYHLVSLVFHVANVVLLHLLCVRLVARGVPGVAGRLGAWLCGVPVALYAVHPLRVEPVAWASCQAYLPSIMFSLLATLAYLRAHPPGGGFRRGWMVGSSALVVLAVLSKGSAVGLPFVFLILDAYPLGRLGPGHASRPALRAALVEKGPILVFCLALIAVAFEAKRTWVVPEETVDPMAVARVAQACYEAWFYLAKTVWPFGITAFYPRPEGGEFLSPVFVACFLGIWPALWAAFRWRRRRPWLAAALAAYLVIVSPYLGLARVGITLAADRYSYGPTMAWVVVACAGLCRLARRPWSRPALIGAGAGTLAVACGLAALCSAQCRVWGSSERLWSQALENAPESSELHDDLGSSLVDSGKHDRAVAELREALSIHPHDFLATYHLGVALNARGDIEAAVAAFREARRLRPTDTRVHVSLGGALMHLGQVDEAIALYREGIRLQPDFPNLHFHLGVALLGRHQVDEAAAELTRAVELRPWYADAHAMLGGACVLRGRQDEAVVHYRKALELVPSLTDARIALGLALARRGRSDEAIVELREAVRRDRGNPETHHIPTAVLAASGRVGEASDEFEEVLRLRPDHAGARAFLARARDHRM